MLGERPTRRLIQNSIERCLSSEDRVDRSPNPIVRFIYEHVRSEIPSYQLLFRQKCLSVLVRRYIHSISHSASARVIRLSRKSMHFQEAEDPIESGNVYAEEHSDRLGSVNFALDGGGMCGYSRALTMRSLNRPTEVSSFALVPALL